MPTRWYDPPIADAVAFIARTALLNADLLDEGAFAYATDHPHGDVEGGLATDLVGNEVGVAHLASPCVVGFGERARTFDSNS